MSKIGIKPIQIPAGVTVTVNEGVIVVKGPKGELSQEIRPEVSVQLENNEIKVSVKIQNKEVRALWGLTRALLANMVTGVTDGFEKKLQMIGVGYRAQKLSDSKISLTVGFSHPVEFMAPAGVTLGVEGNDQIIVSGIDKQQVGLTAAKIREIRKPEPYKGKGIKYENEYVRRKPGKAAKVA